ncbi:MAG: ATP-binding protein [Pseudomonadota bacterium]
MNSLLAIQTGHSHLSRLVLLRSIAVGGQCATLALAYKLFGMQFDWLPMLGTIAGLALLNLATWWRLRLPQPVGNPELFAQLCADVLALSVLLYYAGGSTNPFVSLFLLPLVIAAATLPSRYTWAMAAITTACYTLLMKFYLPLPYPQEDGMAMDEMSMEAMGDMPHDMHSHMMHMDHAAGPNDAFNMHVIGMWLGFVISVAVVAYFVVKMAQAVRARDEALARARENTLRNERIVALGIQAAGAAHEMGTPLSTMSVIIGELQHDTGITGESRDGLDLLDSQVRACKRILDKLLANAQDAANDAPTPLGPFLAEVLDEWQLLRPEVHYQYRFEDANSAGRITSGVALRAALMNLLNNAADVSPERIEIQAHCDAGQFIFKIHDHGPGLTPENAAQAGSAFFTTKQEGRGLGLFLANATLEQLGGRVRLFNREGGGATTEVTLPLQANA